MKWHKLLQNIIAIRHLKCGFCAFVQIARGSLFLLSVYFFYKFYFLFFILLEAKTVFVKEDIDSSGMQWRWVEYFS